MLTVMLTARCTSITALLLLYTVFGASTVVNKSTSMGSRGANETRKPLKVGAVIYHPYIKPCFAHWPENCSDPGFDFLFVKEFLEHLGYFDLETKVYQTIRALVQAIESGAADLSGNSLSL